MARYKITDEFDGRELFRTYKLRLPAVRRKAQELANQEQWGVTIINTDRNTMIGDVVWPRGAR